MEGGTVFHFVSAPPAEVLAMAVEAADGADVRVGGGGGPTMVPQYLEAGPIDVLHLAVTPIVLGRGENLWDGMRNIDLDDTSSSEGGEDGVSHITFTRRESTT